MTIASYRGARFFLPPADDENRTSRILFKVRIIEPDTEAQLCPVCGTFDGCDGEEPDCPEVEVE